MQDSDLQKIADDICTAANSIFPKQTPRYDYKWVLDNEKDNGKSMSCIPVELIDDAVFSTIHALKDYPAYIQFKECVKKNQTVQSLLAIDGECYWTQPEQLINKLIKSAFLSSERYFDSTQLLNELDKLITIIGSGIHEITLAGRLHGIKLETDSIEIEQNIFLVRLDKETINQRQPTVTRSSYSILDYSDSNVEIIITDECPIATNKKTYWQIIEDIKSKLRVKLDNVLNAIKLYHHGRFQVYPVSHHSSLTGNMGAFSPLEPMFISSKVSLNDADIDGLKEVFSVVKNISQDKILERSFSRFLIGLDERIAEEQLVDFVIAWESILCANEKTELSYRFSMNGAVTLCITNNDCEFTKMQKFMKKAYGFRSTIVHGSNSNSIDKDLKNLGFDNLVSFNKELADLYRKAITWLSKIEQKERPFHKDSGWELLLPEAFKNKTQS
jgi:hypothetical protein